MNASAYLHKHGWRGAGHSLDTSDRGLARPLLVAHKKDQAGLGGGGTRTAVGERDTASEWWVEVLERGLRSVGAPAPASAPAAAPVLQNLALGDRRSLYANFVKAETLASTILENQMVGIQENGVEVVSGKDIEGKRHRGKDEKVKKRKESKSKKRKHETSDDVEDDSEPGKRKKSRRSKTGDGDVEDKDVKKLERRKGKKKDKEKIEKKEEKKQKVQSDGEQVEERKSKSKSKSKKKDRLEDESVKRVKKDKKKSKSRKEKAEVEVDVDKDEVRLEELNEELEKMDEQLEEPAQNGIDHAADFVRLESPEPQPVEPVINSDESKVTNKQNDKESVQKIYEEAETQQQQHPNDESDNKDSTPKEPDTTQPAPDTPAPEPPTEMPDPARALRYPLHPESVLFLREQGQTIPLPGDQTDDNELRYKLIRAIENGKESNCNKILRKAYPTVDPNDPSQNGGVMPEVKKSYKAAKYQREKMKRNAKRDAKLWVDVRENPHLYRPNGTYIPPSERGIPIEEIKAKRQNERELKQYAKIQKAAKLKLKEEMKTERRLARKRIRGEKKTKNFIEMQANISAKIQRQKKAKDEADAAAAGMTYDAFIEAREREKIERKRERDEQTAREEGITYEELLDRRRRRHNALEVAAEARNLGLTVEEYENQRADFTDREVGMDNERGAASGMGQHHGRSPIDSLWEKHGGQVKKPRTDTSGNVGPDSHDGEGGISLKNPTSASIAAAGDVELDAEGNQLYVIDTVGDASQGVISKAEEHKRVKDLTPEERKARLQALRERRAERNAAEGVTRMSKKERRKRRAQRKVEILNRMTSDLLRQKKDKERQQAAERAKANGETSLSTGGEGAGRRPPASKQERNQARREARRIIRGVKKGTVAEEDMPPRWQMRGKASKKAKQKEMKTKMNERRNNVLKKARGE